LNDAQRGLEHIIELPFLLSIFGRTISISSPPCQSPLRGVHRKLISSSFVDVIIAVIICENTDETSYITGNCVSFPKIAIEKSNCDCPN
jgi:hypothetical protein